MKFPVHIPFIDKLGVEFLACEGGTAELALTTTEELCNSWGVMHGGVLMTLLDVAMAQAARTPAPAGSPAQAPGGSSGMVTVEMKTSFMRPGQGRLLAKGRVLHRSASMVFCEATIVDAQSQLVAHATGTFKTLRGLPAGGRRIMRADASD